MTDNFEAALYLKESIDALGEQIEMLPEKFRPDPIFSRHDLARSIFIAFCTNASCTQGILQPITRHKFVDAAYELADQYLKKQDAEILGTPQIKEVYETP